MNKIFSILLLVLTVLASPAGAQTNEQQEAYELAALRYYVDVLDSLESIKYITATARGSWRPSSLFEGASKLDGSGRLLRGVSKSLKLLAESSDVKNQPWVARWDKYNNASGFVRKVAAAINLTAEFVDAVQNAKTSAAEDKLRAMSQAIKDISVLVPTSAGVGAYVSVLANAVQSIAKDAAIIEAATKRTNDTIALVNKMIVGEDTTEPEENLPQSAIDEINSRIRELDNQAARRRFGEAYGKITAAETACSEELNINMQEISRLRQTLVAASREVQNINLAKGVNSQLAPLLKLHIQATQNGIIEARSDLRDSRKALAAYHEIKRLEHELVRDQNELTNADLSVAERNATLNIDLLYAQEKLAETAAGLKEFDECARDKLGDPDMDLADLIGTYFPQYMQKDANALRHKIEYLSEMRVERMGDLYRGLQKFNIISFGGEKYEHSLSTYPKNNGITGFVEYRLDGQFGKFHTVVGMQEPYPVNQPACDNSKNMGYRVLVDGVVKAQGILSYGSRAITIDIEGATLLRLEVNDGGDEYWCDWFTWGDPYVTVLSDTNYAD